MASKMLGKRKRQGVGLEMKTFKGNDQQNYLVFRCGASEGSPHRNTRKMWENLWQEQ